MTDLDDVLVELGAEAPRPHPHRRRRGGCRLEASMSDTVFFIYESGIWTTVEGEERQVGEVWNSWARDELSALLSQPAPAPDDAAALAAARAFVDNWGTYRESCQAAGVWSGADETMWTAGETLRQALAALPAHPPAPPEAREREAIAADRTWASGYSAGRAAAMRAAPPAPLPLDVERLARALLDAIPGYHRWMEWPALTQNEVHGREDAMDAEVYSHARAIAAEYARLATPELTDD
jgi:hypothetical protein